MRIKKRSNNQPVRLVWNRDLEGDDASNSSIDKPVTADKRRRFLPDGKLSPFNHSQTVGCLTPMRSARHVCDVSVSVSQRRSRSMTSNIGDSYANAIGQTYSEIGNDCAVSKDAQKETVVDRALRAGRLKLNRKVTLGDIADWAGVKQPSVSEWRLPGRNPTIENARAIALKLDVCVDWLLTGREPMSAGQMADMNLMRLLDYWPFLDDITKGEMLGQAHQVARENQAFVRERNEKQKEAARKAR